MQDLLRYRITLAHSALEGPVELPYASESLGTRRLLEVATSALLVLRRGALLVVDELDASLHPRLVREIVAMFGSPGTNPRHAQLVFTSHDVTLLDPSLLRRDSIWFTEKDQAGVTSLRSLADYHPRKGEALANGYLAGRYGGVPVVRAFGQP
jgi:AAA15 family ATPase/GTPase